MCVYMFSLVKFQSFHHNLGWPYVRFGYVLSFRLQNCVWGIFLIVQKCLGFWPLLIACDEQGWSWYLKSSWNVGSTRNLFRGEMSLAKVTNFFTALGSKSNDAILAAEGVFVFHTMTHRSTMKCSWADSRVKMWRFSDLSGTDCRYLEGEYGDGVSPWNVRKSSHLDAAVCLRTFYWILSPWKLQDLNIIVVTRQWTALLF